MPASREAPTAIALADLIELLLDRFGPFVLSNELGALELRSRDLYLKRDGRWLALYERGAGNPEGRSHLHLAVDRFRHACVCEGSEGTPFLGFFRDAASVTPHRPPLAVYFPSFVDWDHDEAPIPEHRRFFEEWVARHGRAFTLRA